MVVLMSGSVVHMSRSILMLVLFGEIAMVQGRVMSR